jgi:hypothetical protein
MSLKGWEGAIKYSNRIVNESVGIGDNADTTWDLDYPAVDELGDVTDDPTKIEVFLDGVQQTPTTDYTLDGDGGAGSVGEITFVVAPGSSVVITANYYRYQDIGYVQSISPSVSNNLENVYEIGSREPVEIKEGNIDISLDMTRCFIDLSLVSVVIHKDSDADEWLAQNEFDIEVYPAGDTGGNPLMIIRGKFGDYSLDMSQDGILMDSITFTGRTITLTTA